MTSYAVVENMTLKDAHTETGDNTTVVQLIRLVLYASYIEVTQYSSPSHHQPAERYEEYYVTYKRAIMSILNVIGRVFKKARVAFNTLSGAASDRLGWVQVSVSMTLHQMKLRLKRE